jgi:hypothetical protein
MSPPFPMMRPSHPAHGTSIDVVGPPPPTAAIGLTAGAPPYIACGGAIIIGCIAYPPCCIMPACIAGAYPAAGGITPAFIGRGAPQLKQFDFPE